MFQDSKNMLIYIPKKEKEMSKKQIEKIATVLPHALKNASSYVKDNFDKVGQETFYNVT